MSITHSYCTGMLIKLEIIRATPTKDNLGLFYNFLKAPSTVSIDSPLLEYSVSCIYLSIVFFYHALTFFLLIYFLVISQSTLVFHIIITFTMLKCILHELYTSQ